MIRNDHKSTEDKCPICGKRVINGMCLDCGSVASPTIPLTDNDDEYDTEALPLNDVSIPETTDMNDIAAVDPQNNDEAEHSEKAAPTAANLHNNPYADVIPYEAPDYGDNYIPPRSMTVNTGSADAPQYEEIPLPEKNAVRSKLLAEDIKPERNKHWYNYWWLFLLAIILPSEISLLAGIAFTRFDNKEEKKVGIIIIIISAVRFLVSYKLISKIY